MKSYQVNNRNAYKCYNCMSEMYVDRRKVKGRLIERLDGPVYVAMCRCSECGRFSAVQLTRKQYEKEFQERDPYDYT